MVEDRGQATHSLALGAGRRGHSAKRIVLFLFLTSFLTSNLLLLTSTFTPCGYAEDLKAQEAEELFRQGNAAYEKGDYGKAVDEYGKVAASGRESGELYYNLGNAYFRAGMLGKAVLNYRRARRLIPRDADLIANFNYAKSTIKGNPPDEKGLWAWAPLRAYSGRFTINELLIMSSVLYITAVALLMGLLYLPGLGRYLLPAAMLLICLTLVNSTVAWRSARVIGKLAVVMVPEAESRFGPFEAATKFFTLQEGTSVLVLQSKDDWCKVRRSDGKVGWVPQGAVEII